LNRVKEVKMIAGEVNGSRLAYTINAITVDYYMQENVRKFTVRLRGKLNEQALAPTLRLQNSKLG
jgi:hypothetical protein